MNLSGANAPTNATAALLELIDTADDAREYLQERLFAEVMVQLSHARARRSMTQNELANLLNTTQPAISRSESDYRGATEIRRFVAWAVACGAFPRSFELVDVPDWVELARRAVVHNDVLHLFDAPVTASPIGRVASNVAIEQQPTGIPAQGAPLTVVPFDSVTQNRVAA